MRSRREFITLASAARLRRGRSRRARSSGAMPVIGFLDPTAPDAFAHRLRGFRPGPRKRRRLCRARERGYRISLGRESEYDRAARRWRPIWSRRQVAVIVTPGGKSARLAAKAATTTTPIVFVRRRGPRSKAACLVASLARPGRQPDRNQFSQWLSWPRKRLELRRELVPAATRVAVLVNPAEYRECREQRRETRRRLIRATGLQIQVLNASTSREVNDGLRNSRPATGLMPLFSRSRPLLHHPAHPIGPTWRRAHADPSHRIRGADFAEAGGLMSYGANIADAWRQVGVYTGRILKGAKPAELPVVQSIEVRVGHQRRDRENAWPRCPPNAARSRG